MSYPARSKKSNYGNQRHKGNRTFSNKKRKKNYIKIQVEEQNTGYFKIPTDGRKKTITIPSNCTSIEDKENAKFGINIGIKNGNIGFSNGKEDETKAELSSEKHTDKTKDNKENNESKKPKQ